MCPVVATQYWLGRFQVQLQGDLVFFQDRLRKGTWSLPALRFAGLRGRDLIKAHFRDGLLPPAVGFLGESIGERPRYPGDGFFWQYPARTEAVAWERHAAKSSPEGSSDGLNLYIGLPWATWIDLELKQAWPQQSLSTLSRELARLRLWISGFRHALEQEKIVLRVHTVCQHIDWRRMLPLWLRLGITDIWLSHCPRKREAEPLRLHPWALYAVNAEDPSRTVGLQSTTPASARPLLASFIGAHMPHYLSKIRLQLGDLANEPAFLIKISDEWHFEKCVYQEQIGGVPSSTLSVSESVRLYNEALSQSIFSLCPAGAGPNTVRLWESLAVGTIPVLLGDAPLLPELNFPNDLDWNSIVVQTYNDDLARLPNFLRSFSEAELLQRQQNCFLAYRLASRQHCF